MAKSVPACSATSKVSPGSLQFASPSRVTSQGMSARCAVLETGRNSVSPCTMPRIIASRIGKLLHHVPKCGDFVLHHVYQTLGAKYRRLVKRMPKKKALVATGNSVLTIFHALLSDPAATYQDLGPGYYEQRMNTRRQARNHVRGLERLGYQVTIQAINPDTGELLTATA